MAGCCSQAGQQQRVSASALKTVVVDGSIHHRLKNVFSWQGEASTSFKMPIRFTNFGHCGVFFEQVAVWQWCNSICLQLMPPGPNS